MKKIFIKIGLMIDSEDEEIGWIAISCIVFIGLFTGILFYVMSV